MKTHEEIKIELKRSNRSHQLASMLGEMPASTYWRPILDEITEKLRKLGDGEVNVEACNVLMRQKAKSGVM